MIRAADEAAIAIEAFAPERVVSNDSQKAAAKRKS
jgi:hypothetical protein